MQRFTRSGSAAAIMAATVFTATFAHAQTSDTVEHVVSTGSRLSTPSYQAPTPVTSVGTIEILREAKVDIGDVIRELPSVGVTVSQNNGGNSGLLSQANGGISTVNLRNLGVARNLVLLDGQRVVSSNLLDGGADLSTFPSGVVSRIDVVTGGASAAYGSDAVSGVVNLILNKNYEGLKGSISGSNTTMFSHRQLKVELTWGTSFDGGKGHLLIAGDHTLSPDAVFVGDSPRYKAPGIVQNPAATSTNGLPYFIHVNNVGSAQFTQGGLITANTSGVGGVANNALRGIQFVGPNADAVPFNFGTVFGSNCYNGCSAAATLQGTGRLSFLASPYRTSTLFGYASYQVMPKVRASVQLNFGKSYSFTHGAFKTVSQRINADNPFLPASIVTALGTITYPTGVTNAPAQFVTVGTNNLNNYDLTAKPDMHKLCSALHAPCDRQYRVLRRGVATLDGSLGNDWSWTLYAQHSDVRQKQNIANNILNPRYNFAVDPVRVTAANVGTSGLPIGSIQCRALLQPANAAAAAGCVPLNIIGQGQVSTAAQLYVNPGLDPNSGIFMAEDLFMNQEVVAGSMNGVLPFSMPAGEIAVAFGVEYRHEQAGISYSHAQSQAGNFAAGNVIAYSGQYTVKEGFVELGVPLLKDNVVQTLNLNIAGRMTDYSTSGLVETWKIGLTSQLNDDIKLRTTWSLDIRAPNISDLFSAGTRALQTCVYPTTTSPGYACQQSQNGNPNLQPEKAVTVSGGVVLTPSFIEGFSLSADWYSINIHGGIFSTNINTVVARCISGETIYCSQLTFIPGSFTNGAPTIGLVNLSPLNAASFSTSGLDMQADYRTPLFEGDLAVNIMANYTEQQTQTAAGVTYDSAGALGGPLAYAANGTPKTRGKISVSYTEGPWSGTIQGRFLGGAVLTNGVQNLASYGVTLASLSSTGVLVSAPGNGNLIDQNHVNPVGYLDLRLSYKWSDAIQLFGSIDNATNVPQPTDGGNSIYDALGRTVRVGLRFAY